MDYANEDLYIEVLKGIEDEETHPPFMNYMGPGTKIEDRLSLNYKGKKGTKNYFIPTTYSDYVSFEHDLLYYSPDNVIKSYADAKFINDIRSILGYAGIVAQYTRRLGIEGIYNYAIGVSVLKGMKNIFEDFNQIPKIVKDIQDVREAKRMQEAINRNIDKTIENVWQDKTFIELPPEVQKQQLEWYLQKQEYREEYQRLERKLINTFLLKILPKLIFTGYLVAPKILKNVKSIFENVKTFFITNPEYDEIQKRVDKVKDKYEKYLNIVGDFKDAPWYRSLVKTIQQPEGEKFFKVKSNFDKKKAEEAYIDFFDEFKSYAEFMNEKYKGVKGYEPFNIKELNKQNLDKVYDIVDVPSSFIEEIFTKTAEKQKDIDGDKYTDKEQQKIIELNEEIEKVLKKEQDVLFETPAPEDDDEKPIDIPEEEILAILQGKQDKPFETPVIDDDDDKPIDIPEEEITAILQGRQEKPFETSAEIRTTGDLPDFLK